MSDHTSKTNEQRIDEAFTSWCRIIGRELEIHEAAVAIRVRERLEASQGGDRKPIATIDSVMSLVGLKDAKRYLRRALRASTKLHWEDGETLEQVTSDIRWWLSHQDEEVDHADAITQSEYVEELAEEIKQLKLRVASQEIRIGRDRSVLRDVERYLSASQGPDGRELYARVKANREEAEA